MVIHFQFSSAAVMVGDIEGTEAIFLATRHKKRLLNKSYLYANEESLFKVRLMAFIDVLNKNL